MEERLVGRVLPHNEQAEYSVLGAMMVDKKAINVVFEELKAEDFYFDSNRWIFEAMKELEVDGQPIEIVSVADRLKAHDQLDRVGGYAFIAELSTKVSLTENVSYYCRLVRETSILRRLIQGCSSISEKAYRAEENLEDIIDFAETQIFDVAEGNTSNSPVKLDKVLVSSFEILQTRAENKGKLTGLDTGYPDLNRTLNGLQRKDMIVIAGRPAMGKSAFALNLAVNASINSKAKVAVFSLEMGKEQLSQRMLGSTALVELGKLSTGDLQEEDWKRLVEAGKVLSGTSIYIDDTAGITLLELKAKCRNLKMSEGLDLVVIDYLQLMSADGRIENRQQEISKISRGLKVLAKEMDCPVIALSQLSRAPDARTDRRPVISDLRESGAIEQDADIVILLYRDDYYNKDSEEKGIAEAIIAKHRNGPVGTVKFVYKGDYTKFITLTRESEAL